MAGVTALWPRQRQAVAELDGVIGRVEQARRGQLAAAARLAAAGDPAPIRDLLRLTDEYLACLRETRRVALLGAGAGAASPPPVAACG